MRNISVKAVNNVSINIRNREALGIVGESGSGKTTLALSLLNLVPSPGKITSGKLIFDGKIDVLSLSDEELRAFRWKQVAMVFQGALNSFNPVLRIGDQMLETIMEHEKVSKQEALERISRLLKLVRLEPNRTMKAFPHELSGGMKQRAMIATALLLNPRVLILDEPTTALDVISQKYILSILSDLKKKLEISMVLLTHDLAICTELVDRIAVMYAGRIVEVAKMEDLFLKPRHPYTMGLLRAVPSVVGDVRKLEPIPGAPPDMFNLPSGCPFHPRCPYAVERCKREEPYLEEASEDHFVACHRWREV
ncbi:MAG: ABC transporter ATP-binding protein [Candidatus Brockarchaeota archaeon]|nr:ABC transporter ATP-binding protein [Candidatus Brockarchaeota archaeon]